MGLFGSKKPKGTPLPGWGKKIKCSNCGHGKFLNINYRSGDRYDKIYADCAKCGRGVIEDGPCHD